MDQALEGFYSGRTVLVTGFTGETGSWLMQALLMLGADVVGFGMNRAERGRCWQVTDDGQNGDNQAGTAGTGQTQTVAAAQGKVCLTSQDWRCARSMTGQRQSRRVSRGFTR